MATNGLNGNILTGVSSGITDVLSSIQTSLDRIDTLLKDIGTSFATMQKQAKGISSGPGGSGGTGSSTPAMTTPGGDMSAGVGPMALGAMGGSWVMDKAMGATMSLYKDIIPTTASALTLEQLRFNYGRYTSPGSTPLTMAGNQGMGMAQQLQRANMTGTSSIPGYAAMLTGMAKQGGLTGSNQQVINTASAYADLYKYEGVTSEQAVELQAQQISPSSEIAMMALGYKSPRKADGGAENPYVIADDFLTRMTGGRGFRNIQQYNLHATKGGFLYSNFEAANVPLEYLGYTRAMTEARLKYEKEGGNDWNELSMKEKIQTTKDLTGVDDPNQSPQAAESATMAVKALTELGLSKAVVDGWAAANERMNQYLGYLSNLPYLERIATGSGYNSVAQNIEGGLSGLIAVPFIGGILNSLFGNGPSGGLEGLGITGEGDPIGTGVPLTQDQYGELPSNALGEWNVSTDQISKIHQGEMILPSRIAESVRRDLASGGREPQNTPTDLLPTRGSVALAPTSEVSDQQMSIGPVAGPGTAPAQVTINVSVARASEDEAVRLAQRVKDILDQDHYLRAVGKGHGY